MKHQTGEDSGKRRDRSLSAPDAADRLTALVHDLRGLLDGTMRWASIAERAIPDTVDADDDGLERAREQLRTIRGGLERMADLVATAAPTPGLGAARPPISLGEALDHAIDVMRPRAAELGVALRASIVPEAGRQPAGPLYSVILNGLSNAVDAVERAAGRTRRGGEVTASLSRLRPISGRERVVIEITDDGEGPPIGGDPRAVFDPDFSTRGPGRGIGLALARRLVKDLGGTIELTGGGGPAERPGAVLRIEVPAASEGGKVA